MKTGSEPSKWPFYEQMDQYMGTTFLPGEVNFF